MTLAAQLLEGMRAAVFVSFALTLVALLEMAVPLHARGRWNRSHLAPNLTLTLITFATNAFFNAALVLTLFWQQANGVGLLHMSSLGPVATGAIVVVLLDFSFYVAHVSMHKIPALWRFHRVHHSDPAVDVTTTIRQHPGEGVIRYAYVGAFAIALGAAPAAYAVYRTWVTLNAVLEHASIRVPERVDTFLSLLVVTPNMHKVHHSRRPEETDTNYSNIFSVWDRLLSTFTPTKRGLSITYGLDGFDDPATQTTAGLLLVPFRNFPESDVSVASAAGTAS